MKPKGWVLYDAACGFCSWWIPFWRKTINKTGYDITPLQAKWVQDELMLPRELITRDIVLLKQDGSQLVGADAYIFGMKKVWWSSPVGYLLGITPFRQLTWIFYKIFNRNRFFISKICRLNPELSTKSETNLKFEQ